jgi:hypothetical protein
VDEEARCLVTAVAHGLDEGLRGILGTRGGRHPDAHNLTAPEVEDDEGVEDLEAHGDDREPVGSPRLVDVISDEG